MTETPDLRTLADTATAITVDQVVHSLRAEVLHLQAERAQLADRLNTLATARTRVPDDFATALAHSVDTLQTRLSQLKNPLANYAIREFSIEAKVVLDVTPLGTMQYRFAQPEETIDPAHLATIAMTIVPIAKPDVTGTWTAPDFTPMLDVEQIQGVGAKYQKQLNAHNIYTVADLITAGSRVRSSVELASLLEIDRTRLSQWLGHAELLTVRDIDGRAAEVLFDCGITSLAQLAKTSPEELMTRYNAHVEKLGRKTVSPVTLEQVTVWVNAAQAFIGRQSAHTPSEKAPDEEPSNPPANQ